jgi:hypothetical protein
VCGHALLLRLDGLLQHVRSCRDPARLATAPTSKIFIGPSLTAHRSAVRIMGGAYRPAATYAGVSREKDEPSSSSSEARQERRECASVGYTERQKFLSENRASASAPASARMSAA